MADEQRGERPAGRSAEPKREANTVDDGHRFGFVALFGRPNVGKSTLLNALLGEAVAVATALPQTTRERMLGIWSAPEFQAALIDTPGFHAPKSALNEHMVREAVASVRAADVVALLVEMPQLSAAARDEWDPGEGAKAALESARSAAARGVPLILVVTKCDLARDPADYELVVQKWRALAEFVEAIGISVDAGTGLDELGRAVSTRLPEGPPLYRDGELSDRSMRWHAAEIIRGVAFAALERELPYSCAVTIGAYREGRQRDRIEATLHVERNSQKGIVIGAGGRMIRSISMQARTRIAQLTGRPCDLFLDARVTAHWTREPAQLEALGYVADLEVSGRASAKRRSPK